MFCVSTKFTNNDVKISYLSVVKEVWTQKESKNIIYVIKWIEKKEL